VVLLMDAWLMCFLTIFLLNESKYSIVMALWI
jgi:hypothetical protein